MTFTEFNEFSTASVLLAAIKCPVLVSFAGFSGFFFYTNIYNMHYIDHVYIWVGIVHLHIKQQKKESGRLLYIMNKDSNDI